MIKWPIKSYAHDRQKCLKIYMRPFIKTSTKHIYLKHTLALFIAKYELIHRHAMYVIIKRRNFHHHFPIFLFTSYFVFLTTSKYHNFCHKIVAHRFWSLATLFFKDKYSLRVLSSFRSFKKWHYVWNSFHLFGSIYYYFDVR